MDCYWFGDLFRHYCCHHHQLFLAPLRRTARQIIDTIEYNLEQLDDLSVEELQLLKKRVDSLILHTERVKQAETAVGS